MQIAEGTYYLRFGATLKIMLNIIFLFFLEKNTMFVLWTQISVNLHGCGIRDYIFVEAQLYLFFGFFISIPRNIECISH